MNSVCPKGWIQQKDDDLNGFCIKPSEKYEYGFLKPYSCELKKIKNKNVISCLILTNENNNKNFYSHYKMVHEFEL